MRRKRQITEESGAKVPGYIVTFSDMVTLLLTFFVMLLTLAEVQDPELFNKGRDSFIQSIRGFGLGMFWGRKQKPNLGNTKVLYHVIGPDGLTPIRNIDAKEQQVRQIFKRISRSATTMPSPIVGEKIDFSVTGIHFPAGEVTMGESSQRFLKGFCQDLQQTHARNGLKIYVLGLARDAPDDKGQWMLSAKRARAVANYLRSIRASGSVWPIYWWGAGPGGDWVGGDSPISGRSQILIAVLRADRKN